MSSFPCVAKRVVCCKECRKELRSKTNGVWRMSMFHELAELELELRGEQGALTKRQVLRLDRLLKRFHEERLEPTSPIGWALRDIDSPRDFDFR